MPKSKILIEEGCYESSKTVKLGSLSAKSYFMYSNGMDLFYISADKLNFHTIAGRTHIWSISQYKNDDVHLLDVNLLYTKVK